MKIEFVEIANFRRLKAVRIDIDEDTTLLVGPNNSGKSSAVLALHSFLQNGTKFKLSDITLQNLPEIIQLGANWIETDAEVTPTMSANLSRLLPTIDVWISADASELGRAPVAVPLLQDYPGGFGVRLRLEPSDSTKFRQEFIFAYNSAVKLRGVNQDVQLRPTDLVQYLEARLAKDFEIRGYLLNPELIIGKNPFTSPKTEAYHSLADESRSDYVSKMQELDFNLTPVPATLLRDLIRIDMISATRGVSDADADGTSGRLSGISSSFYEEHLHTGPTLTDADIDVIRAEQAAIRESNIFAKAVFKDTLEEIRTMGYPGGGDPGLVFESDLAYERPKRAMHLRHQIDSGMPTQRNLDESLNGLGYQSLIYMVFCLMNFRLSRLQESKKADFKRHSQDSKEGNPSINGVAPIHLVLIEEPEAFLHAQVQQVFIAHALGLLRKGAAIAGTHPLSTQLIVSTHSSHIVQEVPFKCIRYVRRETAHAQRLHPLSTIINLTALFDDDTELSRFTKRYIELNHCNLFFADAVILVEGFAERILVPEMTKMFPFLRAGYVELLQIRGSHAHKLKPLIDILGVPTLVITDIDAMKAVPQNGFTKAGLPKADKRVKAKPKLDSHQTTGNYTLSSWLDRGDLLDDLAKLDADLKVQHSPAGGAVRFAFQAPLSRNKRVIPSTFEDALALANTDIIKDLSNGPLVKKYAEIIRTRKTMSGKATAFYEALKKADKGEFALNLLTEVPSGVHLTPPEYINEALEWLNDELSRRGLFQPSIEVSPTLSSKGAEK